MAKLAERLRPSLRDKRWEDYEELWLDAVEHEQAQIPDFVEAADEARAAGEGERVGVLLSLLAPQADRLATHVRMALLETLVRCLPREREHRTALVACYEQYYGEREGLEVFLRASNLKRTQDPDQAIRQFRRMIDFVPGCFVFHRSGWGVGEIREVSIIEQVAVIDFQGRSAHRVSVEAIPDICTLLAADDFKVLAWKQPERLREMAEQQPLELLKTVLRSAGRPLTLARLRDALAGSVIPSPDWSKWWTKQRAALKRDSEIAVGGEKMAEYFLREGEADPLAELEQRLRGVDLRTQLRLLREALADLPPQGQHRLEPLYKRLHQSLLHRDAEPAVLLEVLLFLHRHGSSPSELLVVSELLEQSGHPGALVNSLSRVEDQTEILDLLRQQDPAGWEKLRTMLLLGADDGPREYLLSLLRAEGRLHEVDALAREVVRLPRRAPLFYLWLARLRCNGTAREYAPCLEELPRADFFLRAVLLLNELGLRAQHEGEVGELELQLRRYRQRLANRPYTLLHQATENADPAIVRDLYQHIENCRGLSDTIRKRVLASILRAFPDLLSQKREVGRIDESVLYATSEAIQRKREELEYLRNEKLPQIYKLIGDAAAMGDLSENYEFTSAIEERENTNRRVLELQGQLDRASRIDISHAATDHMTLGSRAQLTNLDSAQTETYSLLGPWDGDPDHGVVSYLSPLGRALLDRRPGEEFTVSLPTGAARYRLDRITVHSETDTAVR